MSARSSRRLRRGLRWFTFLALGAVVVVEAPSCREDHGATGGHAPGDGAGARPDGATPRESEAGVPNVIAAEDLDGGPCKQAGDECAPGYLCCQPCCLSGASLECTRAVEGTCPLPDIGVNEGALAKGIYLETLDAGPCELEEACLGGAGQRRVLRFDVRVPNKGAADLVLGNPDASDRFEFAPCHNHYHFTDFARYTLLDDAGAAIVVGRKQAFCARDSARADQGAALNPKYDCVSQGIQRGWEDIYDPTLPCQYLDVTEVPSGTYWLEVEVNPGRSITELRYDNNKARVKVVLP